MHIRKLRPAVPIFSLLLALSAGACDTEGDEGDGSPCIAVPMCKVGETKVDSESDCLQDDAVCYEETKCGKSIWCTGPAGATCTAAPECKSGETKVSKESDCLQDDAVCYEVSICDQTIWCTAPAETCTEKPECKEGETKVDGETGCLQDDAVCYKLSKCGKTIWCTGPAGACTEEPSCKEGETEVDSETGCLQDDAVCYKASKCDKTIWCTGPAGGCTAVPTCKEGETEVDDQSGCLQDDAVCYQATECDKTIWCTGPAPAVTTILGGGYSFGECLGACKRDVLIADGAATLKITGWGENESFAENTGTLTETGVAVAAEIAQNLVGTELEETYGCPDCDDGGAAHVILSRMSVTSTHKYDFGRPPEVLKNADAFATALMLALADCETTNHVVPAGGCTAFEP